MKRIAFLGSSIKVIRDFPEVARKTAGHQLYRIQFGLEPDDWKPMKSIGLGVKEIRIHENGEFRVIYIAKLNDEIYVLHAFRKKTQKTSQKDINLAKRRLKEVS